MENRIKYTIENHPGEWVIKNSWISQLNYIMVSFYNEEKGVTLNINTRLTIDEIIKLPGVNKTRPEETNFPDLDIIY